MFNKIINILFKDFYLFSAAYSNNVFPDPLSKEDEERHKTMIGEKYGEERTDRSTETKEI